MCKVSPALEGAFFQGEALGASPIERCSSCKAQLKGCCIYSKDQALISAQAEEEYKIIKDHCKFKEDKGALVVKYPFSKDPLVMLYNG